MSTLITLDNLYTEVCGSIGHGQTVTLRGIEFAGQVHGAVEFVVKFYSRHPEVCGDGADNGLSLQSWADELVKRAGGEPLPFPGVWSDLIFVTDGNEPVTTITRQFTRAMVADYLDQRIRQERPDLVKLGEERREARQGNMVREDRTSRRRRHLRVVATNPGA